MITEPRRHFIHEPISLGYTDLSTSTENTGRTYTTPSGKKYPSITTILGIRGKDAIMEWRRRVGNEEANRVSRHAATRGTALHSIAERYLNNEEKYFTDTEMPHVKAMFHSIKPSIDKYVGKVIMQEVPLYSDFLGIAGRVDLIAEFNGKRSIIDFKTSSRIKAKEDISNYFIQAAFYAIAMEERTTLPVSQLVIMMTVENSNKPLIFLEKRDNWTDELQKAIKEYNASKLFGHS